eukprot:12073707-Alexandrium_andersonii.AAC.1
MKVRNVLACGLGVAQKRHRGIMQGCPWSMMLLAGLLAPWTRLVASFDIVPAVLADDLRVNVKVLTDDQDGRMHALTLYYAGMAITQAYVRIIGGRAVPSKSRQYSSCEFLRKRMRNLTWPGEHGEVNIQ